MSPSIDVSAYHNVLRSFLAEDLGAGDITTETVISSTQRARGEVIAKAPLVLAGIGLAIGAAIGAASPSTEVEDATTGESSDALKKETADLAWEQLKKGQAVAERGWQSATEEAERETSRVVGSKVKSTPGNKRPHLTLH